MKKYCNETDRFRLWARFIAEKAFRCIAEIGVFRGSFAEKMLASAPCIEKYIMIDPWRFIPSWNKPANRDDQAFELCYNEALSVTEFACQKRVILRGTTIEVISQVPDSVLDFVYIDGDHTLKGISIDLISVLPKVKQGGWIAGDDFCDSIWQHPDTFEPTMIFPFAVYFAEAHGLTLYALPHHQFAMQKTSGSYEFVDLTNSFGDTSVRRHLINT